MLVARRIRGAVHTMAGAIELASKEVARLRIAGWRLGISVALGALAGAGVAPIATPAATIPPALQDEQPASPPAAESPLRRRDVPADGIPTQLNFGGFGGGNTCHLGVGGRVPSSVDAGNCTAQVGSSLSFYFHGFAPGEDITVQVTQPDGRVRSERIRATSEGWGMGVAAEWSWDVVPGDPLGLYTVAASQGARQASDAFTVQRASRPLILAVPTQGPPGTAFRIALAGFAPRGAVPLRLYRAVGGTYFYAAELGSAQTDEWGEAVYTLPTQADDPEGSYLVLTEPRVEGASQFGGEIWLGTPAEHANWDAEATTEALARAVVEEANRVWAAVVGRGGAPISALEGVYAGRWLNEVRGSVQAMRTRGQYRTARLTAPIVVRRVTRASDGRIEVLVMEQWDDRLYNGDGSLARVLPGRVEQRYVLELAYREGYACAYCWLVVESDLVRSE